MRTTIRPGALSAALVIAALTCGAASAGAARLVTPPPAPPVPRVPANALFFDDFSTGTAKWSFDDDSLWSVHWGALCADLPDARQLRTFAFAGSADWEDYAVDLDVCQMRGVDKGVVVRVQGSSGFGVDLRGPGYQDVILQRREWPMGRADALNANGMWQHLRIEVRGTRVKVFVNGELKLDRTDGHNSRPQGRIALAAYTGGVGQCTVYYDNVIVTAL